MQITVIEMQKSAFEIQTSKFRNDKVALTKLQISLFQFQVFAFLLELYVITNKYRVGKDLLFYEIQSVFICYFIFSCSIM